MSLATASEFLDTIKTIDIESDRKMWSLIKGHGLPVPHYAHDWFYDDRSAGEPEARATTSIAAVLSLLEEKFPGASISCELEGGRLSVKFEAGYEGANIEAQSERPIHGFDEKLWAMTMLRSLVEMHRQSYEIDKAHYASSSEPG